MKMKKMLAILAALSVLGTTGLTVGAEDTATTTEPATEASTTTETEAETTAAETTAKTETTVETAAAEENQTVKAEETAEFTFNGVKFQAVRLDPQDDPDPTVICVALKINRIEADGSIVETNLSNVDLYVLGDGGGGHEYSNYILDYISIDGDILTIDAYGGNQSYQYVDGQFVPAGTAPTTTTTTAAETTTTTTTTKKEDAQPVTGDFQLDGVTLTPKIETKGQMGDNDGGLFLNIYSADETLLLSIRVALFNGGTGRPEGYYEVSRYLVKTGSNTIVVNDYSHFNVKKYHSYVFENGKFVSTGTTTDDNQEKTFTVEIPYTYFTITDSVTGKVMTDPGASKSVVNIEQITCTNGNVTSLNCGCEVSGSSDRFLQSFTVSDVKPGTLTIKAACGSYSYLPQEYIDAGYTTFRNSGNAIFDYLTVNVTIDENGNIVTGGSDNGDSGKTDNGSASNAPATKNTSGTPKTGDTTTVPAVAVGLTLTAAGVVAFISKRKK